jgi:hypothetical protein
VEVGLPQGKVLKYITLMYDPNSEIKNNVAHLPSRKRICAMIVGFEIVNKRFIPVVEDMLLGKYSRINRAIVAYCFLSNNIYVVAHAAYEDMFSRAVAESYQSFDKETIKNLQDLQDKVIKNEEMILGGKEVAGIKDALYAFTSNIDNIIIPERIVKKLEEGGDLADMNPFPNNYIPNALKYAGVELPK